MLTCDNLTISVNSKTLLSNLGFTLLPGSVLVIKGNNGSGKTTLLRSIAGLSEIKYGRVLWEGYGIHQGDYILQPKINFIGHQNALKLELSVKDNIAFWADLNQTPELVLAAVTYFGLIHILDVPCGKLSAGWRRRVSLARLLACYADLWLLDEPEANLDDDAKQLLFNLIKVRVEQGGIVVMTSHNPIISNAPTINLADFQL